MDKFIIKIGVIAAALWVTVWLIDGLTFDGTWVQFVLIALVFGVVNAVVRPLAKLLSFPIIVVTLGFFALVVNALMFWFVAWLSGPSVLDLGFATTGFWASFFGAIVMALVSFVLNRFLKPSRR